MGVFQARCAVSVRREVIDNGVLGREVVPSTIHIEYAAVPTLDVDELEGGNKCLSLAE